MNSNHDLSQGEMIFLTRPSGTKLKGEVSFETIELEKNRDLCVRFRKDSYICSFGSSENYIREGGDTFYLGWLKNKISQNPGSAVHVKWNGKIIGQLELGELKAQPEVGYVNLYYLAPEFRGKGFAPLLDQYAIQYLRNAGYRSAQLSVSPKNTRAVRFYLKMGWKDLGPNPDHPEVHLMGRPL